MKTIITLLQEAISLLKEIRALLLMQIYDSEYIGQQDMKAFYINVAADIFVEMTEKNPEFKRKVQSNFKL